MQDAIWGQTQVGPRNHVLDGVGYPTGMGNFQELSGPSGSLCCGVCSKWDDSVLSNGMTADCNAPDWSVSNYIVLLSCQHLR